MTSTLGRPSLSWRVARTGLRLRSPVVRPRTARAGPRPVSAVRPPRAPLLVTLSSLPLRRTARTASSSTTMRTAVPSPPRPVASGPPRRRPPPPLSALPRRPQRPPRRPLPLPTVRLRLRRRTLLLLPRSRRRLPLQLYLQGYALQEIADLTDLTLDAARKLVYRGLDEIKQRLAALGLDDFDD